MPLSRTTSHLTQLQLNGVHVWELARAAYIRYVARRPVQSTRMPRKSNTRNVAAASQGRVEGRGKKKGQRNFGPRVAKTFTTWLSKSSSCYPRASDVAALAAATKLNDAQVRTWFVNYRKRNLALACDIEEDNAAAPCETAGLLSALTYDVNHACDSTGVMCVTACSSVSQTSDVKGSCDTTNIVPCEIAWSSAYITGEIDEMLEIIIEDNNPDL